MSRPERTLRGRSTLKVQLPGPLALYEGRTARFFGRSLLVDLHAFAPSVRKKDRSERSASPIVVVTFALRLSS